MKKMIAGLALCLGLAFLAAPQARAADTFKSLSSGIQVLKTSTTYSGAVSSTSATMDLSGGQLDLVDCAVYIHSSNSTGTPTFDVNIQTSIDGTNYGTVGSFTQVTSTTTAQAYTIFKTGVRTGPATKLRLQFLGSANTNWVGVVGKCRAEDD